MTLALARPLNTCRWDPNDVRGHVESWFLKANDPAAPGQALWIKFTLLVPPGGAARREPALCEVWAIRFDGATGRHRAAKASFPIGEAEFAAGGLGVSVGGNLLEPGRTRGSLGTGTDHIRWDLRLDGGDAAPMFGFPHRAMYEGGFPKSKLYTPLPRAVLSGELGGDDGAEVITGWIGMLGHNWGRTHSPSYHWAQCSLFEGPEGPEDTVFEAFSGRIALGPWLSPWLSGGVLRRGGEELRFNAVGALFGNRVRVGPSSWSCVLDNGERRLTWAVRSAPADFVGLRYIDPDGRENHCLNSKIATCTLALERRSGGRLALEAELRGDRSCAYEILTRSHDHGIPLRA